MITPEEKQQRGQFFTVNKRVHQLMKDLLTPQENTWRVLEPSAGAGDLVNLALEKQRERKNAVTLDIDAWELDERIVSQTEIDMTYGDFFQLAKTDKRYHTIIGNPPYVAWKKVEDATRQSAIATKERFDDKVNLYHLFMDKCIDLLEDGGEMVMIVPKEWVFATSSAPLRKKMLDHGSITHFIDGGEEKVFPDAAVPAIMIFRYEKGKKQQGINFKTKFSLEEPYTERSLKVVNESRWLLLTKTQEEQISQWGKLGDNFSVKVGMVSGADNLYHQSNWESKGIIPEESGIRDYLTTKGIQRYIDVTDITLEQDIPPLTLEVLTAHKDELIKRGIKKFSEKDWWKYGAVRNKEMMESDKQRFYCYAKTRVIAPFFVHDKATYYSGGILGIFHKNDSFDSAEVISALNSPFFFSLYEALSLMTGNKVSFQPKTLEDLPFPATNDQLQAFIKGE